MFGFLYHRQATCPRRHPAKVKHLVASLLVVYLLIPFISDAQISLRLDSVPPFYTPLHDPLYVAGSFNNWQPADPAMELQQIAPGRYQLTINTNANPGDTLEFKLLRDGWPQVETQANGAFLPNRQIVYQPGQQIPLVVANWEDMLGTHTATNRTKILRLNYPIPQLNRTRRVWIHLPENYNSRTDSFPVLYLHDGQNLFDRLYTAFGTEWGIDESMDRMAAADPEAILVGIDNGGVDRIAEYTPWVNSQYGGGDGERYVEFIVDSLKPYIDRHFRTLPGREHTGIMGSSLGGLISFYAALEYPQVFSKAGVFSPSFWFSDSVFDYANAHQHTLPMRIYFLAGQQESATMVPKMQAMYNTLLTSGYSPQEMAFVTHQDGQHNEAYWGREYPDAFRWLFQPTPTAQEPMVIQENELQLSDLGNNQWILKGPVKLKRAKLRIFDLGGKLVWEQEIKKGSPVNLREQVPGWYVVILSGKGNGNVQRILIR